MFGDECNAKEQISSHIFIVINTSSIVFIVYTGTLQYITMSSSGLLLSTVLVIVVVVSSELSPIVETNTGDVLGKVMNVNGKLVEAYLGIPFAESPVGNLRFRAPVAKQPWNGILNGTFFGVGCYMIPDDTFGDDFWGSNMWNPSVQLSENCLNLNVWVPSPRPENAAVMVWIYGGSFYGGISSLDVYDGRWIAAEEDVIVVSMNYRMGALGFLVLGDDNAPGNQGLMDQALALEWVQDNIAQFGGNPNRVTLWGKVLVQPVFLTTCSLLLVAGYFIVASYKALRLRLRGHTSQWKKESGEVVKQRVS